MGVGGSRLKDWIEVVGVLLAINTEGVNLCASTLEKLAALSFRDVVLVVNGGKAPQMSLLR